MRKGLYSKPKIGEIDQGSIFNAGVAEDYYGCYVYGIIITPKCDIAHDKVKTYHYLPVVRFNDWIYRDFWHMFNRRLEKDYSARVQNLLKNNGLSPEIVNLTDMEELIQEAPDLFQKAKDSDRFINWLKTLITMNANKMDVDKKILSGLINDNLKAATNIIKEVVFSSNNHYYFLEGWSGDDGFFIVLLREIRKVPMEIGEKISNGLIVESIPDSIKNKVDINFSEELLYCEAKLNSPYIEHLIQMFFRNFGRIGVEDHDPVINSKIDELIKSIN